MPEPASGLPSELGSLCVSPRQQLIPSLPCRLHISAGGRQSYLECCCLGRPRPEALHLLAQPKHLNQAEVNENKERSLRLLVVVVKCNSIDNILSMLSDSA